MTPEKIKSKLNTIRKHIHESTILLDELTNMVHTNLDNHYVPQPGEVVEATDFGVIFYNVIFVKYNKESDEPFVCVGIGDEYLYKSGQSHSNVGWRRCRRLNGEIIEFGRDKVKQLEQSTHASIKFEIDIENPELGIKAEIIPDYTHLLPAGYEFCEEEQAENWVKVEFNTNKDYRQQQLGCIWRINECEMIDEWKPFYRPIRKVQHHVAVHEAVTTEPNPYAVDWSNAPEWADRHAFDEDGKGYWLGSKIGNIKWFTTYQESDFTLPSGLDWKQSKTRRP